MVTTLTVITYQHSLDTYKSSNTDETSIVETTSVVYYKLKLNYYVKYEYYIIKNLLSKIQHVLQQTN